MIICAPGSHGFLVGAWFVNTSRVYHSSKNLPQFPPKKKHTLPIGVVFPDIFPHTPPPNKKITTHTHTHKKKHHHPPPPPKKKKTQKAAKPQQTNQPFRGFFFLTPLSTWIVTWRGNAAATAYPSHLRRDVGAARGQGVCGEVEAGTLKWRNLHPC